MPRLVIVNGFCGEEVAYSPSIGCLMSEIWRPSVHVMDVLLSIGMVFNAV